MNIFDKNTSLLGAAKPVEFPIPLWFSNGTSVGMTNNSWYLLADGSATMTVTTGSVTSAHRLFTLSSNVSASQKFSLEVTVYIGTSGQTTNAALWDFTASGVVSSSQLSTTSTTFITTRSGQFTLVPGHVYGVVLSSTGGYTAYITDASLIVFP